MIQIENFNTDRDNSDISFFAYNYFSNFMRNKEKCNKYWILTTSFYFKK